MNQNGVLVKIPDEKTYDDELSAPSHILSSNGNPLRKDAFQLTNEEKIERITDYFRAIMDTLGLDVKDDNLKESPQRVAEMFINEIFSGLDPRNKPEITLFENKYGHNQMLVEKNITFFSTCEHHFVPIVGKAHIAYIPAMKIIELSKINRIVQYYAKRPQVQERLTVQIADELKRVLHTENVAVLIEATHHCIISRGVEDTQSNTITACYEGRFKNVDVKNEFLSYTK